MADDSTTLITHLRSTLGKMEVALGAIGDSIVWTDSVGRIQWSNATFDRLVNRQRFEVLGTRLLDLLPLKKQGQDLPSNDHPVSMVLSGQLNVAGIYEFQQAERELVLEIEATCVQFKGQETSAVLVIRDLTERERVGEELRQSKQRLSLHVQQTPLAVIEWNLDFEVIDWNPAAEKIFGYSKSEAINLHAFELIVPEDAREHVNSVWTKLLAQEGGIRSTNENRTKNGTTIICEWYNTPLIDHTGSVIGVTSLAQDITERKIAESALRRQEEFLRNVIDTNPNLIFVKDWDGKFTLANKALADLYGTTSKYLIGKSDADFKPNKEEVDHFLLCDTQVIEAMREKVISEETVTDSTGNTRWFQTIKKTIISPDGRGYQVLGVATDITDRKMAEKQLLHDAFHDPLTALPNRALFMERLNYAIKLAKQCKDYRFAVLFLDLDRFKVVNDSLGHMVGDQLLVAIAHRLQACLRPGDTVARLGGDEFTILLTNIQDVETATQVADRIQKELTLPFNLSGHEVFTTVSIGIALSKLGYDRAEDVLRDADTTMYRAKAQGKARSQVFNSTMHTQAMALLQLETDLRRAIAREEFRLHYQPIVALNSGRITGFEALVRWQHPERGLVSPAEFIPVAEETGLIVPIGWWVLSEACRRLRAWQVQFPATEPLTISVNISGKQFLQPDLIEQVRQILLETNLDAQSLRLEITENVLMENTESVVSMLLQLKAMNIQLYMDDFGTGYSSLSYLHRFPIDTLKIDRSFVSKMDINGKNSEIVQTIITLAHNLGMDVVAEGIESEGQRALLKDVGCEYGQGYLFSKPVVAEAAELLIAKQHVCKLDFRLIDRYRGSEKSSVRQLQSAL